MVLASDAEGLEKNAGVELSAGWNILSNGIENALDGVEYVAVPYSGMDPRLVALWNRAP